MKIAFVFVALLVGASGLFAFESLGAGAQQALVGRTQGAEADFTSADIVRTPTLGGQTQAGIMSWASRLDEVRRTRYLFKLNAADGSWGRKLYQLPEHVADIVRAEVDELYDAVSSVLDHSGQSPEQARRFHPAQETLDGTRRVEVKTLNELVGEHADGPAVQREALAAMAARVSVLKQTAQAASEQFLVRGTAAAQSDAYQKLRALLGERLELEETRIRKYTLLGEPASKRFRDWMYESSSDPGRRASVVPQEGEGVIYFRNWNGVAPNYEELARIDYFYDKLRGLLEQYRYFLGVGFDGDVFAARRASMDVEVSPTNGRIIWIPPQLSELGDNKLAEIRKVLQKRHPELTAAEPRIVPAAKAASTKPFQLVAKQFEERVRADGWNLNVKEKPTQEVLPHTAQVRFQHFYAQDAQAFRGTAILEFGEEAKQNLKAEWVARAAQLYSEHRKMIYDSRVDVVMDLSPNGARSGYVHVGPSRSHVRIGVDHPDFANTLKRLLDDAAR